MQITQTVLKTTKGKYTGGLSSVSSQSEPDMRMRPMRERETNTR